MKGYLFHALLFPLRCFFSLQVVSFGFSFKLETLFPMCSGSLQSGCVLNVRKEVTDCKFHCVQGICQQLPGAVELIGRTKKFHGGPHMSASLGPFSKTVVLSLLAL